MYTKHVKNSKTNREIFSNLYRIFDSALVDSMSATFERQDAETQALIKDLIQNIQWKCIFPNSKHVNVVSSPTDLIMLELTVENPHELFERIKERAINEYCLVCACISCSGDRLRLCFPVPAGIPESTAMRYYIRELSLPCVDFSQKLDAIYSIYPPMITLLNNNILYGKNLHSQLS